MTALPARALARLTPLPTPDDAQVRDRMQRDRLRSSLTWLAAGVVGAQFAGLSVFVAASTPGGWVWFGSTAVVALAMLAVGGAQLLLLARAEPRRRSTAASSALVAALGVAIAPVAGLLMIVLGPLHLVAPIAAMATGIALLVARPRRCAPAPRPLIGALAGAAVALLALAVGVLDALVLLPMTLVPGMPLPELYAALAAAREDGGTWVPIAWAGLWAVAVVLLATGLVRARRSQRGTVGTLLAASVAALAALPVTQFSIGMGIADTLVTSGGMSMAFPAIALAAPVLAAAAAASLIGTARG